MDACEVSNRTMSDVNIGARRAFKASTLPPATGGKPVGVAKDL